MSILNQIGTGLRSKVGQFVQNRDGNVGLLFGLSLLPMVAASGAAIDYSRASDSRTQLANALDSTVLAVAKQSPLLTDSELKVEAAKHFQAVLTNRHDLAVLPLTVSRNGRTIAVSTSGTLKTSFMQVFGHRTLEVAARAEASLSQRKVELALALDNTGSMRDLGKMDKLKEATLNLIDTAAKVSGGSGMVKVSLVPYTTQVRVDPFSVGMPSWLVFQRDTADRAFDDIRLRMVSKSDWKGCMTDRGPGFDTNDRRADIARPDSLYAAIACDRNLAMIQPLTDNWSALRNTVNSMVADGCTNVTIGARYGLAALSPSGNGPVGGAVPLGTADVDKYLVILTDGLNTQNRFTNACGTSGNPLLIDDKTKAVCDEIKTKPMRRDARGNIVPAINVITVRVMEGNVSLLKGCATKPSDYKEVKNASEINAVFQDIIREILSLRLSA
jgi:Flp pilus assembly protein TadG